MSFSSDLKKEIEKMEIWKLNTNMTQQEQLSRMYIRESFLKSGFVNDPNKEYHLEIVFDKKQKAEEIIKLLYDFNINVKSIKRNNKYMIYIKDGEEISKFLALIGANNAVLKFEEIRVIKDTRNNINRLVNCETANLNKTINASVSQIINIKYLKRIKKFDELPDNLKEIAELRIKNPEATLNELGKMLKKPISKSGVMHRLKKICKIASELRT